MLISFHQIFTENTKNAAQLLKYVPKYVPSMLSCKVVQRPVMQIMIHVLLSENKHYMLQGPWMCMY